MNVMFRPEIAVKFWDGKATTVRPVRKRRLPVGHSVSLRVWTGKPYRSKQKEFGRAVVVGFRRIEFTAKNLTIDDLTIGKDGREAVAKRDGFESWNDFVKFFNVPFFTGNLIEFGDIALGERL